MPTRVAPGRDLSRNWRLAVSDWIASRLIRAQVGPNRAKLAREEGSGGQWTEATWTRATWVGIWHERPGADPFPCKVRPEPVNEQRSSLVVRQHSIWTASGTTGAAAPRGWSPGRPARPGLSAQPCAPCPRSEEHTAELQ